MQLSLVKSEKFGTVLCDFYQDANSQMFYVTREQIGRALEYSDPRVAIAKIHERYKDRLDHFSVVTKLTSTDGKHYDTTVYSPKGIYEICRWSRQPKADQFYDWVYGMLEALRTGKAKIIQTPQTELEALAALGNAVSLMANQMIQAQQKVEVLETKVTNIQEAFDPELHDKPWRTWVKTSISRLAKSKGGYADDYQTTYANLYALLEQRAGCRLTERLNNRKERARRLGLPKSGVEKLNHIDVIEADKRLKEIFTSLIREALVAIA